jgi:aldose 1-epimerase
MHTLSIFACTALALGATALGADSTMTIKREPFATTADGQAVERFTLTNRSGAHASFITWGATLTELWVPDRKGQLADVTLGFDTPEPWLKPNPFFGAIAGRYANRIAKGKFTLDGKEYTLAVNNGANHLHGGKVGFDKRHWKAAPHDDGSLTFAYDSPDGEEGYPGTLHVTVTYRLTDENALRLDYAATADAPTVLNLTNHTYWNLSGAHDILAHELRIPAAKYTAVDAGSIPTGVLAPVKGTMDFTTAKPMGRDIGELITTPGGGYDHNYILDGWEPGKMVTAAEVFDPASGRTMRVTTTQPAVQFYTGNYLKDVTGKGGKKYDKFGGFCLETQHFPDSPNHPDFPTTVLRPGETFRSTTVYEFGVK